MHRRSVLHFRSRCPWRSANSARGRHRRRRLCSGPLNHSPQLYKLTPQRVILRSKVLVEFAELPPKLVLSPEEDEAEKYEYELHYGHSPVSTWLCNPNSRTARPGSLALYFYPEPRGIMGWSGRAGQGRIRGVGERRIEGAGTVPRGTAAPGWSSDPNASPAQVIRLSVRAYFFPTTRTSNCPPSAVDRNSSWVLGSSAMVLAFGRVLTVSTAEYLSGLSWWITEIVPSPLERKIRRESSSNAVASTWSPMGSVVTTFPDSESTTAMTLLRQPMNRR